MDENVCFVNHLFGRNIFHSVHNSRNENLYALLASVNSSMKVFSPDELYVTCNGKAVCIEDIAQNGNVYHIIPRLCGGKGGFGSMLRAIGAQIEKTTNHEACRDLSGRRMRDVNNEKQLKEWIGKKAQKEKEQEEKRRERLAQRRAMPNHKFDDPLYEKQKNQVAENLEDAIQSGLQKTLSKPGPSHSLGSAKEDDRGCGSRKRAAEANPSTCTKVRKTTEWLGIDIEGLSDSDSEENTSAKDGELISLQGIEKDSSSAENSNSSCDNSDSQQKNSHGPCLSSDNLGDDSGNPCDNNDIPRNTSESGCSTNKISGESITEKIDSSNETLEAKSTGDDMPNSSKHGLLTALENVPTSQQAQVEDKTNAKEEPIDLESVSSADELECLGLEKLKAELMSRGLKCGGTLQQRAERLFSVRGLAPHEIKPSLLAKTTNEKEKKKK